MGESCGGGEHAPNHSSLLHRAESEAEFVNPAGVVVGRPSTGGSEIAGHCLLLRYQQAYASRYIASERSDLDRRLSERRRSDERSQGGRDAQTCEATIGHFGTPPQRSSGAYSPRQLCAERSFERRSMSKRTLA